MGMIRYAVTVTTLAFAAVGILSSRGLMAAEQREPSGAELVLEMLAGINATKQLPADAAAGDVSRALGAEAFARGFLIATRANWMNWASPRFPIRRHRSKWLKSSRSL